VSGGYKGMHNSLSSSVLILDAVLILDTFHVILDSRMTLDP
jgi:hypothetical protein